MDEFESMDGGLGFLVHSLARISLEALAEFDDASLEAMPSADRKRYGHAVTATGAIFYLTKKMRPGMSVDDMASIVAEYMKGGSLL